ncbi:hypothetical protein PRUPE_8G030600 [Prunus persica]|uniref:Uncharacterized protein n=1 Tax=Prunus persica TaxID=3760 RepID=A0A251MVG0_PRUPE|nr:hypothetical protein PRUPE_8G030600 [Prunus persica]
MVEFQPLCVKNPPIDGWLRTCSCGHQPATKPLPLVSATNSGGKIADSPTNDQVSLPRRRETCYLQVPNKTQ